MSDLHGAAAFLASSLLKIAVASDQPLQAERIRGALAAYSESREPSLADLALFLESLSSIARALGEGGPRGATL